MFEAMGTRRRNGRTDADVGRPTGTSRHCKDCSKARTAACGWTSTTAAYKIKKWSRCVQWNGTCPCEASPGQNTNEGSGLTMIVAFTQTAEQSVEAERPRHFSESCKQSHQWTGHAGKWQSQKHVRTCSRYLNARILTVHMCSP